jgi:glycosyltransferase involved in cell wall biosynthesis
MKQIFAHYPTQVDLTSTEHLELLKRAVNEILTKIKDRPEIEKTEQEILSSDTNLPIFSLLALKLAKSILIIDEIKEPVFVSVVFAVYKEHNRIMKNSDHPHGEDFLLRKISQMEWLFNRNKNINWQLIVVDDGCPEDSGQIAKKIIHEYGLESRARVVFLQDAIDKSLDIISSLESTSDSQKGGSIIYGMWDAIQQSDHKNHIVVYTDADLSTHLGQLGLLLEPILFNEKHVSIGSRREKDSVVIKKGSRNNRGKLFIYLWKRLIPNLGEIIDTQCGFKAFTKEILHDILKDLIERKFAFDIELLLKSEIKVINSIAKVAIAWIDSEAASTTSDIQPYLPMLKSIVKMNRKYFTGDFSSIEFANLIDDLDEAAFNHLLEHIPEDITSREPYEFNEFKGVTAKDLSL